MVGPQVDEMAGELRAIVDEQARWRTSLLDQPVQNLNDMLGT